MSLESRMRPFNARTFAPMCTRRASWRRRGSLGAFYQSVSRSHRAGNLMAIHPLYGRSRELADLRLRSIGPQQARQHLSTLWRSGHRQDAARAELVQRGRDRASRYFGAALGKSRGAFVLALGPGAGGVFADGTRCGLMSRARAPATFGPLLSQGCVVWFQQPELESLRLGSAIVALLQRLSRERPLVLVFDDLHASDLASLNLLEVLAHELPTFVCSYLGTTASSRRNVSEEVGAADQLGREGTVRPLGRLDEGAVTQWPRRCWVRRHILSCLACSRRRRATRSSSPRSRS